MKKEEVFLTLLRCYLKNEELNSEVVEVLKKQENLAHLYEISKKYDLAHLICFILDKNGFISDDLVSKKFLKQQQMALFRDTQMQYNREKIKEILTRESIKTVFLKGSIIRLYYPETWMRTSCDIDVLVCEEDLDKACGVLESNGYESGERSYRDISVIAPDGVHIELHFSLKQAVKDVDLILDKVWDYVDEDGQLKTEFFYFHNIAHMAHHFRRGGCGIRPFIDLWLMEKCLQLDYEVIKTFCQTGGLESFYVMVKRLMNAWFDNGEFDDNLRDMQDYLLSAGLYGSLENRVLIGKSKKGGKFKYFVSRLFLPYDVLKEYYPSLKGKRVLTIFYQVRRWFSLLSKEKRRKAIEELNVTASKEKTKKIDNIIKILDL